MLLRLDAVRFRVFVYFYMEPDFTEYMGRKRSYTKLFILQNVLITIYLISLLQLSDGIRIVDLQESQNQVFLKLQSKGLKGGGMTYLSLLINCKVKAFSNTVGS